MPIPEQTPQERLGTALRERDQTIAVAESCTGGFVGSLISDVPGSSDYFIGGVISYMNRTKHRLLAISREAIEAHGAVSEPVAREMAQHIRDEAGADWGVSTTGYAGPTTDGDDKPVGTVYIGIASAGAKSPAHTTVEHHQFDGDRHEVRDKIGIQALESTLNRLHSEPA